MNKLQGKDLINVGIFTAIYFVVMMAIAMLGFIPIFLPLLIVLVPLLHPMAVAFGVDPIQFALIFNFNMAIGAAWGIGALLPVPCSVSWLILF